MSWTVLSPSIVGLGALALAGGLFLLARLRVRHRERVVPTTLFWKRAIEETHARELVERFRHPLAYAATVAIALLLWFAWAGPRVEPDRSVERVVLVDGAALDPARWERLAEELPGLVDGFARGTSRFVFTGATRADLVGGAEEGPLAAERLAALRQDLAPRGLERSLVALGRDRADERPLELWVVAPTPVRAETLALLDDDVTVRALEVDGVALEGNRGITVLGVAEAASGRFDAVDVRIVETGPVGEDPLVAFDDVALRLERVDRDTNPERRVGVLRDVPANGRTLRVSFPTPDAFPADDVAAIALPRRTPVRVALELDDPNLRAVLERDPGVELVEADAEVRVGSGVDGTLPALELADAGAEQDAFTVVFSDEAEPSDVLLDAWERLGIGAIDGTALAEELGAPVGFGARHGTRRAVRVRADLLSSAYDFVDARAFPLFVAGAVRWLARVESLGDEVRAGEPLTSAVAGTWVDDAGRRFPSAGAAFRPPVAGRFTSVRGEAAADEVWASLLDEALSREGRGGGATFGEAVEAPDERSWLDAVGWLALLAGLALGAEWWAHQRGRMP